MLTPTFSPLTLEMIWLQERGREESYTFPQMLIKELEEVRDRACIPILHGGSGWLSLFSILPLCDDCWLSIGRSNSSPTSIHFILTFIANIGSSVSGWHLSGSQELVKYFFSEKWYISFMVSLFTQTWWCLWNIFQSGLCWCGGGQLVMCWCYLEILGLSTVLRRSILPSLPPCVLLKFKQIEITGAWNLSSELTWFSILMVLIRRAWNVLID